MSAARTTAGAWRWLSRRATRLSDSRWTPASERRATVRVSSRAAGCRRVRRRLRVGRGGADGALVRPGRPGLVAMRVATEPCGVARAPTASPLEAAEAAGPAAGRAVAEALAGRVLA